MGLFDIFKKNKEKQYDINKGLAEEVFAELEKNTTLPYMEISNTQYKTAITDSKFGGIPYFPKDMEFPTDSKEKMLRLLAQINCKDIKGLEDFPDRGILQFFVLNNDVSGLNFDDATLQDTFRVIYHGKIDETVSERDIRERYHPYMEGDEDYFPIQGEFRLEFKLNNESISQEDYRTEEMFVQLFNSKSRDMKITKIYDLDEDLYNEYAEKYQGGGHKMGGYPFFTQEDPRGYQENLQDMDVLLLQIDSDFGGNQENIMWGDSGVCNFFINGELLKNRDFSKVAYNWDCY